MRRAATPAPGSPSARAHTRAAAAAGRDALRTSAEYRFGCFLACSLVLRSDIVETHLRAGPLSESLLSAGGEEAEALVRGRRVGARALSAALLIAAKLMANQEAKDILHHEQARAPAAAAQGDAPRCPPHP